MPAKSKATNPNAKADEDSRSAKDLIDLIRQRSDEIRDILVRLEQIP